MALTVATHFAIFHAYITLIFKTEALHLDSNKGRVKGLLLLYKRLTQPYLSLLLQLIPLLRPHLLVTLKARAIKQN